MNIIGQPDVYEKPISSWFDRNISPLLKNQPKIGELRIKWYTVECQAEGMGEIVEIEQWDGDYWIQYGLDSHDTIQDLLDLSWKIPDLCEICGEQMSANCNNAGCDYGC